MIKTTTKIVTLRVNVLHEDHIDPEVICEQAILVYDREDAAIEDSTVIKVSDEQAISNSFSGSNL